MKEVWYIRTAGFITGFFIVKIITALLNKNFELMIYAGFVVLTGLLLARAEYIIMTKTN